MPCIKLIKTKEELIMEEKKIFSKKMALFLRQHGCRVIKTEPNLYRPQFDVYIFLDTPELEAAIAEYMSNR